MFDVDKYFVFSEDRSGRWVSSVCKFEVFIDLVEFSEFGLVLNSF